MTKNGLLQLPPPPTPLKVEPRKRDTNNEYSTEADWTETGDHIAVCPCLAQTAVLLRPVIIRENRQNAQLWHILTNVTSCVHCGGKQHICTVSQN